MRFFINNPLDMGIEFFDTEKEAKQAAEDALEIAIDNDAEHDDVMMICWGRVLEQVEIVSVDEYGLCQAALKP